MSSGEITIRKGKGRKDRSIFIGDHTRSRLMAYYAVQGTPGRMDPVWSARHGASV